MAAGYRCDRCAERIERPTLYLADMAGRWHMKEAHGVCFCGSPLAEHPPGPPCPPPPPPGRPVS